MRACIPDVPRHFFAGPVAPSRVVATACYSVSCIIKFYLPAVAQLPLGKPTWDALSLAHTHNLAGRALRVGNRSRLGTINKESMARRRNSKRLPMRRAASNMRSDSCNYFAHTPAAALIVRGAQ